MTQESIFSKIIIGDIACQKVYEDSFVLCFNDVRPLAPVHVLIIPKTPYRSFDDFSHRASDHEIAAFFRAIGKVAHQTGVHESGYRLITNHGTDAHQEVMHFHVHLLGGASLGAMMGPQD